MPRIVFHVAPACERGSIRVAGLEPRAPAGGFPQGVYVFHDQRNAEFFRAVMTDRDRDEYGSGDLGRELWEVTLADADELHEDPAVTDADAFQDEYPVQPLRSSYLTTPVPASRLRLTAANVPTR